MNKYTSIGISLGSFILTFIGFLMANKDIKISLIAGLLVLTIVLFVLICVIYKDLKNTKNELNGIKENRETLINQYKKKQKQLELYSKYWSELNLVFLCAINSSEEGRLKTAYETYLLLSKHNEEE